MERRITDARGFATSSIRTSAMQFAYFFELITGRRMNKKNARQQRNMKPDTKVNLTKEGGRLIPVQYTHGTCHIYGRNL